MGLALYGVATALGRSPDDLPADLILGVFVLTAPPLFGLTVLFLRHLDHRGLASIGARWPDGGRARALERAIELVR